MDKIVDDWICPHITGKVPTYHKFDNEFFGYSIKQSESMNPEERQQLEVAYEALVDAGLDPAEIRGTNTGLYKGDCFCPTSMLNHDPFYPLNTPANVTTRTMFHYDLKGPFFHCDTACSSSFGGYHEAVQAIKYGRCDAALVIGSNTVFDPMISFQMNNMTFVSKTGECRSLDADANGYLRSEANVALFLQKRKHAKRCYATIMKTTFNCDGYKAEGITFPGRESQEQLMKSAYEELGMSTDVIKYIEGHVTGTVAGDPVETAAIFNTYCTNGRKEPLLLGCVKSNLGHTEGASGVVAVAKAIATFQEEAIAPNIHMRTPNPKCSGIHDGKIVPVVRTTMFTGNFCALNSFGFGGANIHCILRKEPKSGQKAVDVSKSGPRLVCAHGRTAAAVEHMYDYIKSSPKNQEPEFLYLMDNYATSSGNMPFRGYFLMDRSGKQLKWDQVRPRSTQCQPVSLYFSDCLSDTNNNNNNEDVLVPELMLLKPFEAQISKMKDTVKLLQMNIYDLLDRESDLTPTESIIRTLAVQLALVETLKAVDLNPKTVMGKSIGGLACAYWHGQITAEEALLVASCSQVLGENNHGEDRKLTQMLSKINEDKKWTLITNETKFNGNYPLLVEVAADGLSLKGTNKTRDLNQTLHTLGQLYMNGCDLKVANMYPKPNLPLPSTTPSLSPLVKWDHVHNHSMTMVQPHLGKNLFTTHFKTMAFFYSFRGSEDNFYLGHKIDGRYLFPAIGYLGIAWQAMGRLLNKPPNEFSVEFRDVYFLRATIVNPEKDLVLTCRIDEKTGRFEVKEREVVAVHGFITLAPDFEGQLPDFIPEKSSDDVFEIKSKDLYKELRVRGYDYEDFFTPVRHVTSDGKSGEVAWRDTMSKQLRDNIQATAGYASVEWIRKWICFTDGLLQLMLASENVIGRGLFVPTKIQSLKVNPMIFQASVDTSPKYEDTLTFDQGSLVKCYGCSFEASVFTTGCHVRGMKTSLLKRQRDPVLTLKSDFLPLNEQVYIDSLAKCPPANFDDDNYYPTRFIDPLLQFITENIVTGKVTMNILECTETAFNISTVVQDLMKENFYSDVIKIQYALMTNIPKSSLTGSFESVIKETDSLTTGSYQVIIWRNLYSFNESTNADKIDIFSKALADQGFILTLTSGKEESQNLKNMICQKGLVHCLEKTLLVGETLTAMLFRKSGLQLKAEDQVIVPISMDDFEWVTTLKEKMAEVAEKENSRIWLIPDSNEVYFEEKVGGTLGLTKSLRFENGGHKIRCVIDHRLKNTINFQEPEYAQLLRQDFPFNVYDETQGKWGGYVNFYTDIEEVATTKEEPKDVYLKPLKPGDLSSLVWAESHIPYQKTRSTLIDVYYSPLNFKDVMHATGNLPMDLVYGLPPEVAKDSLLGMEFSGKDRDGRRVFGTLALKAMATTVEVSEDEFIFPVPDNWTLLEASTVPVVYLTALYALEMCGSIRTGESILIHAGAGGVGLAALNICTHKKMNIFVTVGSKEKKDYLMANFPTLKPEQILNSRSMKFEEDLLRATDGQGVDVVLNCLAGPLQEAGLRCLAVNGRFLEIGKTDLLRDSPLNHTDYGMNQSFIGVCLDRLFKPKVGMPWTFPRQDNDRSVLSALMQRGIQEGFVKPLKTNVYNMSQVEEAFRYMATGKHIGKIVLQIRDEETNKVQYIAPDQNQYSSPAPLKHLKQSYFYSHKSYIVVGGMGGLGLEVVQWMVERGATNIVVSSRRGAVNTYQKWVMRRLKRQKIKIVVSPADSTTEQGAIQLVTEAHKLGAVGGIINSAVVLNDTLFEDLTPETFKPVADAKTKTSYFLDKISREYCPELDLFICFSSISNNRGNPGQTNYNFGNCAMEEVCRQRKKDGYPALAIEWGIIGDVGLVMDMGGYNGTVILSSKTQRVESCLETLDKLMQRDETVVVSYVKSYASNADIASETDLLKLLHRTLGFTDASSVDKNASLSSLGLDSLMAVELQQIVERLKGVSLSIQAIRDMTIADFMELAKEKA